MPKKLLFLDKALLGPIETSAASQKSLFVFAEFMRMSIGKRGVGQGHARPGGARHLGEALNNNGKKTAKPW